MALVKAKNLRRMIEKDGRGKVIQEMRTALEEKHLTPADFSVRELAEGTVTDADGEPIGEAWVRSLDPRTGGEPLTEARNAVDTSAFSTITGQVVYNRMLEAYQDPGFIGDQLFTTIPTTLNGERIPGVGRLGDKSEVVDEGMPYPTAGVSEDWIDTPVTTKHGLIVPVTKEAVFFDRTGLVLQRASEVGTALGIRKEKAQIDLACGVTNAYKWKGTAYDTYYASGDGGPWINANVEVLADYTDINSAQLLFEAITDPDTGEPVVMGGQWSIWFPGALKATVNRVLNATQVLYGAFATDAANIQTMGATPVDTDFARITSPLIYSRTSSATNWFIGQPKRAFAVMENWPLTVVQAPTNSEVEFTHDIVARYKASDRYSLAVLDPRFVFKSAGTG